MSTPDAAIAAIVGLGNPGAKYEATRHNIGFMAIERLAEAWGIRLTFEKRFHGKYGEGRTPQGYLIRLLEPTTFMNASGQAVGAIAKWYKLEARSILTVYDDMDLPFGNLRLRKSGSAGGHNGIKSLIAHLGTQDFPRLRLGIGKPKGQNADDAAIGHVLGRFSAAETAALPAMLQLAQEAIAMAMSDGIDKSMNLYNTRAI